MDTRTPKSAREDALAGLFIMLLSSLAAQAATGATRLAKLLADDKRKGGGLVSRMLPGPDLEFGPDLRAAQFACNIAGVQTR